MSILDTAGIEKRALVVAPHADDEVLGAGGFMALAVKHGWEVHASLATISGYPSAARGDVSDTKSRQTEVDAAARVLGVAALDSLYLGEEHHLRLDTIPQIDLVRFVERGLKRLRPSLVVVPTRGHHHQDHRALADACAAALRPAPGGTLPLVPVVLACGHPAAGWGGHNFNPTVFVDITATIETKLEALACYQSQLCPAPHPRSLYAVRAQCAAWGALTGVHYAEAFECWRFLIS